MMIIADDCDIVKIELWREEVLIESLEGTDQFIFHQVAPDSYKCK